MNYQWYVTTYREKQIKELKKIPEYGKKGLAEVIEMALDDFILKHGKSNNPQTEITLFQDQLIKAIPNIYENPEAFRKFYRLLNKEEYKLLDKQLNMILAVHNGFLD